LESSAQALRRAGRLRKFLSAENPSIIHHHDGLIWTHWMSHNIRELVRYGHAHLDPPLPTAALRHRLANQFHRRTYNYLVCVSEATRRKWIDGGFPEERSETIRNGVDITFFKPGTLAERAASRRFFNLSPQAHVIAFVDSPFAAKDRTTLQDAGAPADFHGLIAGTGPDERSLMCWLTRLVSDRVVFTGLMTSEGTCRGRAG
jgi:glycosyltransferase involved in cell wall biosynthesis